MYNECNDTPRYIPVKYPTKTTLQACQKTYTDYQDCRVCSVKPGNWLTSKTG